MEFLQHFVNTPFRHQIISELELWPLLVEAEYNISEITQEAIRQDNLEIFQKLLTYPDLSYRWLAQGAVIAPNPVYFTTLVEKLTDEDTVSLIYWLWSYNHLDHLKQVLHRPGVLELMYREYEDVIRGMDSWFLELFEADSDIRKVVRDIVDSLNMKAPGWNVIDSDLSRRSLNTYIDSMIK